MRDTTYLKQLLRVNITLLIVTTSYVTLGLFAPGVAAKLWAPYAIITFTLAVITVAKQINHEQTSRHE